MVRISASSDQPSIDALCPGLYAAPVTRDEDEWASPTRVIWYGWSAQSPSLRASAAHPELP
jgi:hypothetical protein